MAYKNFLKSQLGDDVYIKSVGIDSNGIGDLVESLITHPFEQVNANKFNYPSVIDLKVFAD